VVQDARRGGSDPASSKTRCRSLAQTSNKLWLVRHMAQFLRIDSSATPSIGGRRLGMLAHVKACPAFSALLDVLSTISYWAVIASTPRYCTDRRLNTVSRHVSAAVSICPITSMDSRIKIPEAWLPICLVIFNVVLWVAVNLNVA
jgi:hypothetical protein